MSDETLNPGKNIPSGDPVRNANTDGDLSDTEQTGKDMSYSPSSGRETEVLQDSPDSASAALDDTDINPDDVNVLPGTGGPDDVGDVEVDPADLDLEGNAGIS